MHIIEKKLFTHLLMDIFFNVRFYALLQDFIKKSMFTHFIHQVS